jgi:parallel beta-helix repeat protein
MLIPSAYSWTPLEGHFTNNTVLGLLNSPYRIVKDVIIDPGVKLTIEPGVVIQIADGFSLIVNGSLSAIGTEDEFIEFTSSRLEPDPGLWNTILFVGDSTESLSLKYVIVSHANNGITIESEDGDAIIERCEIIGNSGNGVNIIGNSKVLIRDNIINNNTNGISAEVPTPEKGVLTELGGFTVSGNTISYNREYGIYVTNTNLNFLKNIIIVENKLTNNVENGIHLTSNSEISNVQISHNEISFSGANGIYMFSFSMNDLTISSNDILSNNANGIYLSNPRHPRIPANISRLTLSENTLDSNRQNGIFVLSRGYFRNSEILKNIAQFNGIDGISLNSEKSLYGLIISDNTASENIKNGISLSGEHFRSLMYDADLFFNLVVGNEIGFSISGSINTNFTSNSVSFNEFGLFFSTTGRNRAYNNDIYSNTFGMNVTSGAIVVAEWNYWGDSTGPYHLSVNPEGKGNPVNGNGVDLDFLPYLFASSGGTSNRPVARLEVQPTRVFRDESVRFDASSSSGDEPVSKFFFSFGDGENSGWITSPVINHSYSELGSYDASVTVQDSNGLRSINLAAGSVSVVKEPSVMTVFMKATPISIMSGGEVSVTARVKEGAEELVDANITFTSNRGGNFSEISGLTDTNGEFEATFIAPTVVRQTTITITAWASKSGFYNTSEFNFVIVAGTNATLAVQVSAIPLRLQPGEQSVVTLLVSNGTNPIDDVSISISTFNEGTVSPESGKTDKNGTFTTIYTAPTSITPAKFGVKVDAKKSGYFDGGGEMELMILERTTTTTTTTTTTRTTSQTTADTDQTSTYLLMAVVLAPVAVIIGWIIVSRRSSTRPIEYGIESEESENMFSGLINKITNIIRRIRK